MAWIPTSIRNFNANFTIGHYQVALIEPLFQNEPLFKSFQVKMSLIWMKMNLYIYM